MNSLKKNALRVAPAMTALGALLLFAPQMQAQDDDHRGDCRDRIEHAQAKLDHEMNEHGQDSLQVRHAQHELNEAREHCDAAYGDQRQYDNRSADSGDYRDNGRYNDRRDDDRYSNRDNSQYNRNDNGQYNNPNYNPNNDPNYNNNPNYNNGQTQQPYPDQQPH